MVSGTIRGSQLNMSECKCVSKNTGDYKIDHVNSGYQCENLLEKEEFGGPAHNKLLHVINELLYERNKFILCCFRARQSNPATTGYVWLFNLKLNKIYNSVLCS